MPDWPDLLRKPTDLTESNDLTTWFTNIAEHLMAGPQLRVAGHLYRFVELEFYYYGPGHLDPFTHRESIQTECGRWYFHRTRGVYRGGSFKGLDLTFGDGTAFGGVLIRGIETPEGNLIDGPSLCVDYLLARTGHETVAALDKAIAGRPCWDESSPLSLRPASAAEKVPLLRSARVGLSLKRLKTSPEPPRYILRSYRYLSESKRTAKGKQHVVLALHAQGKDVDAIHQLTGCPRGTVQRYVTDFEAGRRSTDFGPYFGIDLGPKDLSRLHGTWHVLHGGG